MGSIGVREGDRVGDLLIGREIGRGAFGVVYRAYDTLLGRDVALKVLHARSQDVAPNERPRILREARLIGSIRSANVVTLYRIHDLDGRLAFELELMTGGSLDERLERVGLPDLAWTLAILRGIANGLEAAHAAGVVHGDVKPANVLLDEHGTPKLADFGLGRVFRDTEFTAEAQGPAGTPLYMAPEVVMGERPTFAADLWSFGVILYRMLSGRLPFDGPNLLEVFLAIQNEAPPPLEPPVPPNLIALAEQCLTKRPADRVVHPTRFLGAPGRSEFETPQPVPPPRPAPDRTGVLVGRARERERGQEHLDALVRGVGMALLVSGDAGIGKTAFAREMVEMSRRRGCAVVETQVSPLKGLLRTLLEALEVHASGSTAPHEIESEQQLAWIIEKLLERVSAAAPLLLVVEDIHHADAGATRLLTAIARRLVPMRVLLVATMRPGDFDDSACVALLLAAPEFSHMTLERLADEAILQILERECGGEGLAVEVSHRLVRMADGNPLFATELFRDLRERGTVVLDEGRWKPGPDWSRMRPPPRLRDVVARRVGEMNAGERALLDAAAVDGFAFDGKVIAAVLEEPLLHVLRALQRIYRERGIVVPRSERYTFSHPIVQEVLYDEVAPALRVATHRRLAEILEGSPGVDPERIGLHWERAGDLARARPYLMEAAVAAESRQDILRALEFFERAGLAETSGARDADALLSYAVCLCDLARHEDAEAIYGRLLALARETGDEQLRLRTVTRRARKLFPVLGVAVLDEEELRQAAQQLRASRERALAHWNLGTLHRSRGELEPAREEYEAAARLYKHAGHTSGLATALDSLATVSALTGDLEQADAQYTQAAALARSVGCRTNAAISDVNRALRRFQGGALDGTIPLLEAAIRTLELEGHAAVADHARMILCHLQYATGSIETALLTARTALARLEQTGNLQGLNAGHVAISQLLASRGEISAALEHAQRAWDYADRSGYANGRLHASIATMVAHALGGEETRAAAAANDVIEIASGAGAMTMDEALERVSEAVLYGLPPAVLASAPAFVDASFEVVRAGVLALEAGRAVEHIEAAANRMLSDRVGERRAERRILGGWLRAEASLRRGDRDEALDLVRAALARATELGFVSLGTKLAKRLAEF